MAESSGSVRRIREHGRLIYVETTKAGNVPTITNLVGRGNVTTATGLAADSNNGICSKEGSNRTGTIIGGFRTAIVLLNV